MFIGTGTTVAFSSGFFAEILSVSPVSASRNSVESSHMATPNNSHTFLPTDLVDWGEMTVELGFAPGTKPPIQNATETITITFPDSAASTWTFLGFMTGFDADDPLEDRATATAVIKYTGDLTVA